MLSFAGANGETAIAVPTCRRGSADFELNPLIPRLSILSDLQRAAAIRLRKAATIADPTKSSEGASAPSSSSSSSAAPNNVAHLAMVMNSAVNNEDFEIDVSVPEEEDTPMGNLAAKTHGNPGELDIVLGSGRNNHIFNYRALLLPDTINPPTGPPVSRYWQQDHALRCRNGWDPYVSEGCHPAPRPPPLAPVHHEIGIRPGHLERKIAREPAETSHSNLDLLTPTSTAQGARFTELASELADVRATLEETRHVVQDQARENDKLQKDVIHLTRLNSTATAKYDRPKQKFKVTSSSLRRLWQL
ncbi:hypothetical protein B0H63DRAFT_565882 [Podospora didyma]|uniref:Uncharacterized protein n=1 Tax=Podospora didyma TaxID=330526 RepID=A0AAE0JYJ6_9PEZI|nr:hypothetical protein B0H63DRAFT_565882 [Podospora didyma]